MLERFLILAIVLIASVLILERLTRIKTGQKINSNLFRSHGIRLNNSHPSVLYFWSDYCAPCRSQSLILKNLKQEFHNINFIHLNAVNEKKVASSLNIKTVPAIAVITSDKEVKFLNQGFTREEILKKELEEVY
ncbi:MAG TPA: thioredoxin family protein [Ignavibacteriaceae bacterium]|nr:thioredoxin family protein [Ignavibacteriaceae bacterium]